ncbi:MFS transporter [Candidatus Protochlamydia phocaeensis]|uniref:MFS transporter n=1 Tax=Candidatus Protochlamydia phocaeensis TaxID=1414722 RepID=UPI0008388192|nr:MFS transporter [Candidatus Protochlamydia phocaeensis]
MEDNKTTLWLGVSVIWMAHLIMDFMIGVWPVYKTLVTIDLVVAGLIASLGMFIGEGLQLYFGFLSDKGHHQKLLVLGIGLTATIPFLSYVENEWILFTFILCCFLGSGAFHPAASGMLIGWVPKYKSFLIALFACGGMIGAAISQYVFRYFFVQFEGQTWFLAVPILCVTLGCLCFRFPAIKKQERRIHFKDMLRIIHPYRFQLGLLYFIQLCLQVIVLSFSFLLPDILKIKGYEEWFCLGGGYFYFVIGSAIASLPIGYCVHKWGYRLVLAVIIFISAVVLSYFLAIETLSLPPVIVLLLLLGGSMGVVVPVVVAGGNALVPVEASGFISALYMGGCTCLAGFGPTLAGLLASYMEKNAPVVAMQMLSVLFLAAFAFLFFLPDPTKKYANDGKGSVEVLNS